MQKMVRIKRKEDRKEEKKQNEEETINIRDSVSRCIHNLRWYNQLIWIMLNWFKEISNELENNCKEQVIIKCGTFEF